MGSGSLQAACGGHTGLGEQPPEQGTGAPRVHPTSLLCESLFIILIRDPFYFAIIMN